MNGGAGPGRRRAATEGPLVIRGGDVVTPEGVVRGDVVIEDGRVVAVVPGGHGGRSGAPHHRPVEAEGLLVLPGMVDAHVHFDEPGRVHWEGFDTGSAAAVAGGVTTVVDMPIDCDPPTVTAAAVGAKADAALAHSRVDVAMWGGLVPASVAHLGELLDAGVVGFKAFACPSGWAEFPPADAACLTAGLDVAAAAGVPVAVHCELAAEGHTVESEVAAVRWAAGLAAAAGARLHVVHASCAAAVDEARRWPTVTVETCPHYLLLDDRTAAEIGPRARCFPPIRSMADRLALWDRVLSGAVDTLASDHSPCPPERRVGPEAWGGIDGVGLTVPLLLGEARLPLERLVALTTAAARLLGLSGKGALAAGFDADVVLVDPAATWTVTEPALRTRHRAAPYTGMTVRGRVVATFVRGRLVFDGRDVGPPGGGRVLRRGRAG